MERTAVTADLRFLQVCGFPRLTPGKPADFQEHEVCAHEASRNIVQSIRSNSKAYTVAGREEERSPKPEGRRLSACLEPGDHGAYNPVQVAAKGALGRERGMCETEAFGQGSRGEWRVDWRCLSRRSWLRRGIGTSSLQRLEGRCSGQPRMRVRRLHATGIEVV